MHKGNEPALDISTYLIVGLIAVFAIYKKYLENLDFESIASSLMKSVSHFVFSYVIPGGLFIVITYKSYKIIRKYHRKQGEIKDEIKSIGCKVYNNFSEINKAYDRLEELMIKYPKYADLLQQAIGELQEICDGLIVEQKRNKSKLRRQQKQIIKNKYLIQKLVKYFQKTNSAKAIPQWALKYSSDIIKEAEKDYENLVTEEQKRQNKRNEAIDFVKEYKNYPSNFNELDKEEQKMHIEALKLLKSGKLETKPEIKVPDEYKHLVERNFFHANDLDPIVRDRLIHEFGYRHKSFIFADGKSGNNLIIRNDERKESDYHFCMKHLFAEIDKINSIIEYSKDGLRADVAFEFDGKKIAVEIETGSNKDLQIAQKVKWLNQNFDYWVFVCSRANLKAYRRYSDNKRSFCLTLKDAYSKVSSFATDSKDSFESNKPTVAEIELSPSNS